VASYHPSHCRAVITTTIPSLLQHAPPQLQSPTLLSPASMALSQVSYCIIFPHTSSRNLSPCYTIMCNANYLSRRLTLSQFAVSASEQEPLYPDDEDVEEILMRLRHGHDYYRPQGRCLCCFIFLFHILSTCGTVSNIFLQPSLLHHFHFSSLLTTK
jgi:hypothetical protein